MRKVVTANRTTSLHLDCPYAGFPVEYGSKFAIHGSKSASRHFHNHAPISIDFVMYIPLLPHPNIQSWSHENIRSESQVFVQHKS